jgi:5-methyltetrahydrofolate--homocysteine methyltransferase
MKGYLVDGLQDSGSEAALQELLERRVLVLDGAMGTALQGRDLTAADFGGPALEGCNENLILTRPDVVSAIHDSYFAAGADIVETNTFGAVRHVLAEYGLQDKTLELNKIGARLAKESAKRFSTKDKPRFVAGALGPGTKTIMVTGGITFDEVAAYYAEASQALLEGGADLLLLETQQDTLNVKASLVGVRRAFEKLGRRVPVSLSVSIETMGTMLGGQTAEALAESVSHYGLLALGLNCATGPDFMTDHLRTISDLASCKVICYPNAGLPDENGRYNETPQMVAQKLARFAEHGWLNIVGGCCGTTPEHIRLVAEMAGHAKPRKAAPTRRSAVAGLEGFVVEDDKRPILVGERTNVIGSKLFRELIINEDFEAASEIGRRQVRNGAHIVDVCLANPDRDELADMTRFLDKVTRKIKAPIMLDSTDAKVLEEALKKCPGKCIINSINLEDGEERYEEVLPLAKAYGAALIVGTIDEDKQSGMAVTRQRKLEIAQRSYDLLTKKYGVEPEDIYFDPLVFPCGTGDKNYLGSAIETIEGIRLIKRALPRTKTILGISNVSFGLPAAGREVLNSVFMHHCVQAGLDLAIVNSEKLARYASIPEAEKALVDDVLHSRPNSVENFTAHFRAAKPKEQGPSERSKMPLEQRLARNVVEGSREGLTDDLAELLKTKKPLEIINGPLMKGMDEVGKLFAANDMIVAEVLQCAEVMKVAVGFLEPHMDSKSTSTRGKVVLATVKGDVHDIGKNLVHIILKNNGYEIHDLGIKVEPAVLIEAVKKIAPSILGLSGLLVKSAQQMVITAEDLKTAGVRIPILVGGAALSSRFTAKRIAPAYGGPVFYAKDAMMGLDLANDWVNPERREFLMAKNNELQEHLRVEEPAPAIPAAPVQKKVITHGEIPTPPDLKLHVVDNIGADELFKYVNPIMLYGKHLGLKPRTEGTKADELRKRVADLQNEILAKGWFSPKGVFRFFAATPQGDTLHLLDRHGGKTLQSFDFPRQSSGEGLCLTDFVAPEGDYVGMFVVTCGAGVREISDKFRDDGEYLKSHALQALAIESAEGFAELLHERMRAMWGFADPAELTIREKFQAKYRGLRVSFGYPACPNLEDQVKLFALLDPPKNAGVTLTEGFMMEPEASVSALVFHNPQAHYFSVSSSVAAEKP